MKKIFFFLFFATVNLVVLAGDSIRVVILHTNDTHSQVEPTSAAAPENADMGGYARRMGILQQIRGEEQNVLLFDAGDFCQGSPYFNFYNGRIEIDALNRMKYDAATLGNHEFDNGIDTLAVILKNAKFPILSSNYDVSKTALRGMIKPYIIIKRFGLKIGVMALNVNPFSLIIENNYSGLVYNEPLEAANRMAEFLKKTKRCDVVVCLSHLGYTDDVKIARGTRNIDVIAGGHSHTVLENASETNLDGKKVVIGQTGKSGLRLGRIDLVVKKDSK
ncbi:MAG: metallophosphatase [Paludibacter sp.]|jgi:5'-nucleotidase|nr:metallophosphatase [Paludibacter sp.]